MLVLIAAASGFFVARALVYINRADMRRVPWWFTDGAMTIALVLTVVIVLACYRELSFGRAILAIALADITLAVVSMVDAAISRAMVSPPEETRRR